MKPKNDSSRKILESISIFGGLQVFLIVANLLKVKALAIFVGVAGVGHFAILNNILNLVVQFAFLGLNFSAVRSIALALQAKNPTEVIKTYSVFKYWTYVCAVFGLIITIVGSRIISYASFDTTSETSTMIALSVGVFFTILFNGNTAFLQGLRELKFMAKSSLYSAVIGLVISAFLFYFYGQNAIVYSIIIAAFLSFVFSSFFVKNTGYKTVKLSLVKIYTEGSIMVQLGVVMMASSFIGTAVIYLINIYIVKVGSVEDLGLFSAGNGITNQYVGLIFVAMAADYFPKLSSISAHRKKVNNLVNNQGEILLLIICPILLVLMSFSPLVIKVFLSDKFLSITNFIGIMAIAMLFKAAAYPIGYISFAKGDKKVFFLFEGVLNSILILLGHTLGYYWGGVNGIAYGVLLLYMIYFISVNILAKSRYKFSLSRRYLVILIISAFFLVLGYINFMMLENYYKYISSVLILLLSLTFSFNEMNKKIPLTSFLKNKLKSFSGR